LLLPVGRPLPDVPQDRREGRRAARRDGPPRAPDRYRQRRRTGRHCRHRSRVMNKLRSDVVINRALLTNPALDSGAIAVRGTVFHVFSEAGDHDVTILRDGRVAGRFTVAVQPEGAVPQVNVDLAGLAADADRSGNVTGHYAVREGGVMGFAVSLGVGRFAVVISHTAGGGSRTVLDSRGQLPAGDLFAVTPVT